MAAVRLGRLVTDHLLPPGLRGRFCLSEALRSGVSRVLLLTGVALRVLPA
jgi:hypothetical protein